MPKRKPPKKFFQFRAKSYRTNYTLVAVHLNVENRNKNMILNGFISIDWEKLILSIDFDLFLKIIYSFVKKIYTFLNWTELSHI